MSGWLPSGYAPPTAALVPYGHRLRRESLTDGPRLCVAVPGLDLADAERLLRVRLAEMERRAAYTYALLDHDETALVGEVRVAPGSDADADADVSWWIVPECRGTDLARAVDALVPIWVASAWPFVAPRLAAPPAGPTIGIRP